MLGIIVNIIKLYKETEDKEQREWFLLTAIMLFFLLASIITTFFYENSSRLYYKSNNVLFVLNIIVFMLLIGGRQKIKNIFADIKRIYKNKETLALSQYGDILLLIVYITSVLSFIFVLDLSFIKNYGIKVGAVVSVTFVKLTKDLFSSKSKSG